MKTLQSKLSASFLLFCCVGLLCLLPGCFHKKTVTYKVFKPVYASFETIRQSVKAEAPHALTAPGKIYYYNGFLFINEKMKGVHVIDNRNPSAPAPVAFIAIPGNVDLAVRNNVLYADSYTDLVAIDISSPATARVLNRVNSVFPYTFEYPENSYNIEYPNPENGVVVAWNEEEITVDADQGFPFCGTGMEGDVTAFAPASGGVKNSPGQSPSALPPAGVGGSMARFTLAGAYLYCVDHSTLRAFNLENAQNPVLVSETQVGWNIETIFPANDYLFMASSTGMFVYSLDNPASPVYLSQVQHLPACDPVYVQGNTAYVTLRSGSACGQTAVNELRIVDVTDIQNPVEKYAYPMTNPHGLSVDGDRLFLCDGADGLKVFDVSDLSKIGERQLAHFPGMNAYDVIQFNKTVMLIGPDGFRQYAYSEDNANLQLLSTLPVVAQ